MTSKQTKISIDELKRRICVTSNNIGLVDIVIREWDRNLLDSWFTDGVVRERKNDHGDNNYRMDDRIDIGYLEKNREIGGYTIHSFRINPFAFAEAKSQEFVRALKSEGLIAGEFVPFGGIFPHPEEQRRLRERSQTAIYM